MIFAKSKNCRNYYLFIVFFFLISLICICAFLNSNEAILSEIIIILFFGIYFFIGGLGLLIILVFYYNTRFKKLHRKIRIEGTGLTWVLINFLILGFLLIYLTNSSEMIIFGFYLVIKVSLFSIAGIGQCLYDRKTKKKEEIQISAQEHTPPNLSVSSQSLAPNTSLTLAL